MSLSKILTSRVGIAATLASIMIAGVGSASAQTTNFNQNFSADATGMNVIPGYTDLVWNGSGYGANCTTGRGDIFSTGAPAGTSTRWQGLQTTFPAQYGYVNSIRVYIDPCASIYTAPPSRSTSSDVPVVPKPVFNIISGLNLAGGTGIAGEAAFLFEGNTIVLNPDGSYDSDQIADDNTDLDPMDPSYGVADTVKKLVRVNVDFDAAGSFTNLDGYSVSPSCYGDYTICEAGWYTFATRFYTNLVGGNVTVQFIIQNEDSSCALHTFCAIDTGYELSEVGGQRYGLISGSNLEKLKVDDVQSIKGRAPKGIAQTVNLQEDCWGARICLGADVYPVGADTQFRLTTDVSSYLGSTSPNSADGWFCWPKVRFCLNSDVSGTTNFNYQVNDGSTVSLAAKVTIVVAAVNDPPTFDLLYNTSTSALNLNEETVPVVHSISGTAYNIYEGAPDEVVPQVVYFDVVNDNNALFATQPTISSAGTLVFKFAANASGFAIVTVTARDTGVPVAHSAPETFKISAAPVNSAPSITGYANIPAINEDATTGNTFNFTLVDKETSTPDDFTLSYTSSNNNIIDGSAITDNSSSTGTMTVTATFTLKPNAFGSVGITIHATDDGDGGGGAPGANVSNAVPKTVTINVISKNDAPDFLFSNTYSSDAGVSATTLSAPGIKVSFPVVGNFYPNASAPGTDTFEASQVALSYVITDGSGNTPDRTKFSTFPTMTTAGVITYGLAANFSGSYDLKIKVLDNGGTSNGGVNTSVAHILHLQLTP